MSHRERTNGHAVRDGQRWEYAPAPEARHIVKIQPRYELFIGGEFVPPKADNTSPPSTLPTRRS
jgi:hypothetical protein